MNSMASRLRLVISFMLLVVIISPAQGEKSQQSKKVKSVIECRLIIKERIKGSPPNELAVLEVAIKNVSDKKLEIVSTYGPAIREYLKAEVFSPDGKKAIIGGSTSLSPFGEPILTTLEPQQVTRVHLGSVGHKGPGKYRVRVIFENQNLKAVSPILEFDLKPLQGN